MFFWPVSDIMPPFRMDGEPMSIVYMSQSLASLSYLVLPQDTNPGGTLHGGRYLTLLDETAYAAAMKFCRRHILTGQFDGVLQKAVRRGQQITSRARVIYAGKSSMVIHVAAQGEDLRTGECFPCAEAYFTCVAVEDETLLPVAVPTLAAQTDEEKAWMEKGNAMAARFKEKLRQDDTDIE